MNIILISGKARHGKDTAAQFIEAELKRRGKTVLIVHYGDLVKFVCHTYFNWNGEKDEAGRSLLQFVGTDVVRTNNPDFWTTFTADILTYFKDGWDYVIIPDCRFPNELSVMSSRGFHTTHLQIFRPNYTSPLTEQQQQHESETALDSTVPDHYINNYGTLEELDHELKLWVADYLSDPEVH